MCSSSYAVQVLDEVWAQTGTIPSAADGGTSNTASSNRSRVGSTAASSSAVSEEVLRMLGRLLSLDCEVRRLWMQFYCRV